ncbi:MAG: urease subunit beta [Candidatus Dormibacteraeota bacterium]|nr:urease subunit beta [Candidatus Dormibacteraeota bacterium]
MKLGPTEQARLLVFQIAELARRQRSRGLRLNAPEAIAIACDEMHMAARAGGTFGEVVAAGMASIAPEQLLDGVAALIAEIRVEVLMNEGTRLIVLRGLGATDATAAVDPGATVVVDGVLTLNDGLSSFVLEVLNDSDHQIRVSSHFPFDRVNRRLRFDREAARGSRLDIPAGDTVRWAPGERRTVRLVRVRGLEVKA